MITSMFNTERGTGSTSGYLHPYCATDVTDYIYYPLNRFTLLLIIPQVAPNKSFTCHLQVPFSPRPSFEIVFYRERYVVFQYITNVLTYCASIKILKCILYNNNNCDVNNNYYQPIQIIILTFHSK